MHINVMLRSAGQALAPASCTGNLTRLSQQHRNIPSNVDTFTFTLF